jgi:hypothetical protein
MSWEGGSGEAGDRAWVRGLAGLAAWLYLLSEMEKAAR